MLLGCGDLLISEFGRDYGTYFSILQLIASGKTTQREIDSIIEKNTGAYLVNLEMEYSLIKRNKPVFSKAESRNIRWSLNDNFLLFWFRFIYPNQSMIELGKNDKLRDYIEQNYEQFSCQILERYFREKIAEDEAITQIGNTWDRKGENELSKFNVEFRGLSIEIYVSFVTCVFVFNTNSGFRLSLFGPGRGYSLTFVSLITNTNNRFSFSRILSKSLQKRECSIQNTPVFLHNNYQIL